MAQQFDQKLEDARALLEETAPASPAPRRLTPLRVAAAAAAAAAAGALALSAAADGRSGAATVGRMRGGLVQLDAEESACAFEKGCYTAEGSISCPRGCIAGVSGSRVKGVTKGALCGPPGDVELAGSDAPDCPSVEEEQKEEREVEKKTEIAAEEDRIGGPRLVSNVPMACENCLQHHNALKCDAEAGRSTFAGDGAMEVELWGQTQTKYFQGARIVEGGKGMVLTMDPFEKVYLMNKPIPSSTNFNDFVQFQLVGNRVSVDVDMGNPGPGCGCNVAFFLVSMPSGTNYGDHYCDANCVGGKCCPEFDLMEMNVHTLQVTSHQCSDYRHPPHGSASWACDHGGQPIVKFGNGKKDFGPGWGFTIDSQRKFNFKMEFPTEGGSLNGHIYITQDGKTISGTMYNLESMRGPLTDGMTLVLDAWHSTDLTWLDGGSCQKPEYCNMKDTVFSNLKLEKLGGPAPAPSPSPSGSCPGRGNCGCWWADKWGCGRDDGTECFCRCCCEKKGGWCRWSR